jgi:hypothetical protein
MDQLQPNRGRKTGDRKQECYKHFHLTSSVSCVCAVMAQAGPFLDDASRRGNPALKSRTKFVLRFVLDFTAAVHDLREMDDVVESWKSHEYHCIS